MTLELGQSPFDHFRVSGGEESPDTTGQSALGNWGQSRRKSGLTESVTEKIPPYMASVMQGKVEKAG